MPARTGQGVATYARAIIGLSGARESRGRLEAPRPSASGCQPPRPAAGSARFAGSSLRPEKKDKAPPPRPYARDPTTKLSGNSRDQGKARHRRLPHMARAGKEDEAPPPNARTTVRPSAGRGWGRGKPRQARLPPVLQRSSAGDHHHRPFDLPRGEPLTPGETRTRCRHLTQPTAPGPLEPGKAAAGSTPTAVCLRPEG